MKHQVTLTVASLISLLLLVVHLSDDIVRGFSPGGPGNLTAVVIMAIWLYAALVLAGRRSGCALLFLLSIFGSGIPYLHMRGAGMVGGRIAHTNGMVLWVFTLLASGAVSMFSAALAARGLWNPQWLQSGRER